MEVWIGMVLLPDQSINLRENRRWGLVNVVKNEAEAEPLSSIVPCLSKWRCLRKWTRLLIAFILEGVPKHRTRILITGSIPCKLIA